MATGFIRTDAIPASSRIKTWPQGYPVGAMTKPTLRTVEPATHSGKREALAMTDYMFALNRG